ncbi:MAG: AAA family ATPase, partial [Pirellula sp.]
MPAIKLDATELLEVLRLTPSEQNVMLVGRHGIGKSQIVTHFFQEQGGKVVTFFLGQMSDPGDLIGLLHKNEKTGHSEFMPPYWWPMDNKPIVLFLDELNRARPEILQSVMDLALNRKLAGKPLPLGSRVISAVNEGDEYQLTDLDPALISRFNIYEFAPTVQDWLVWASEAKLDHRVVDFIQQNSEYLDADPKAKSNPNSSTFGNELVRTPDRRSWERVARAIKGVDAINDLHVKWIAGVVGATAAAHLAKSIRSQQVIGADDILLRFETTKSQLAALQVHDFAGLNERIVLSTVTRIGGVPLVFANAHLTYDEPSQ